MCMVFCRDHSLFLLLLIFDTRRSSFINDDSYGWDVHGNSEKIFIYKKKIFFAAFCRKFSFHLLQVKLFTFIVNIIRCHLFKE